MYPLDDTIAAIASPPGGAARGIVRISGPQAINCLMQFFQPDGGQPLLLVRSSHVIAGSLRLPELHGPLPCDAYLWPDGRSYTGQPVAEIHTIGSPPLLDLLLRSLCASGTRLAGPGEFTLRAFLAVRIDLTQAEAVLGVIDAGGPQELRVALGQLAGNLARPLDRLRDKLLNLLADVEAGLDFADEDLAVIAPGELLRQLAAAEADIEAIVQQMASRCDLSHDIRVVLVGRPNTGKSSLFNALAGHGAALVSDQPGTTRDYLVAELHLDGVKCQLIDTAGTGDEGWKAGDEGWAVHRPLNRSIDTAMQSTTAAQRRSSRFELLCLDSTRPLDAWERDELTHTANCPIVVLTKCDAPRRTDCDCDALETSSVSGHGIAELRDELRRRALAAEEHRGDVVADTAVRCAESLRLASQCLRCAREVASAGREELAAAEIRTALEELGKVVGAVYTEDVLDRIFSRFCVGK